MPKLANILPGWIPSKLKWLAVYSSVLVFLLFKNGLIVVHRFIKKTSIALSPYRTLLVALLIVLAIMSLPMFSDSEKQVQSVITYSTDTPDEVKPTNSYEWHGNSDDPKKINLPSINAEGYIQKVGVDQNQQIAVPNNIHVAGWFVNSVRPGQNGLSIIDGHVDGRSSEGGIFKRLKDLQIDQEFTVELGSGQALKYKVLSIKSIKTEESGGQLFSQDPDVPSQLNLITCGGKFDQNSRQYEERVIVSSQLIDGR